MAPRRSGMAVPFALSRGLRERSLYAHFHHLRQFQAYLNRIDLRVLHGLTPMLITGFITESGQRYERRSIEPGFPR